MAGVQIVETRIKNFAHNDEDEFEVWVLPVEDYITGDGLEIKGAQLVTSFFKDNYATVWKFTTELDEEDLVIHNGTVESTTDAQVNPSVYLKAFLCLIKDDRVRAMYPFSPVGTGFKVPPTPTVTSWSEIAIRRDLQTPAEIDGCIAWGMSSTLSGANGAAIASAPELSGSGAAISQSNADFKPALLIEDGARIVRFSEASRGLSITGLPQFDTSKCTLMGVFRKVADAGLDYRVFMSPVNAQNTDVPLLAFQTGSDQLGSMVYPFMWPTPRHLDASKFSFIAISIDRYATGSPGRGMTICVDGNIFFRNFNQRGNDITEMLTGRLSTEAHIGGWNDGGTFGSGGDSQGWALFNRALSVEELLARWKYFAKVLPKMKPYTTPSEFWLFEGDSMTAGRLLELPDIAYAERVLATRTATVKSYNVAVLGQTLQHIVDDQATQIYPILSANSGMAKKIAILWAGTNDIAAGSTPASVYANLLLYISNARTIIPTLPFVVLTMLPRQSDSTVEANRQSYNTLIRNGATANNYTVADVGADATIGLAGAQDDEDYYNDTIHLTSEGNRIVAEGYVVPAVNSIL